MRRCPLLVFVCVFLAAPTAGWGDPTSSKVWLELPRVTAPGSYAVPCAPEPNERALQRRALRGRPDRVAALRGGPDPREIERLHEQGIEVLYVSRLLSAVSLRVTPGQLDRLRGEFGHDRLRPVRRWLRPPLRIEPGPQAAFGGPLPKRAGLDYGPSLEQIAQIEVDQLHARGLSGNGVRSLVLDTGFVTDHEALDHLRVIAERDFVFDDLVTSDEAEDVSGQHRHGTGVLAVMAGRAPGDLIGPAYRTEVVLGKTEKLDTETRIEEDNFVAALEWGEALGVDLVTASLGYLEFPDEEDSFAYDFEDLDGDTAVTTRAMDDVVALGVVTLSAVGNLGSRGPSSLMTPSDGDSVLAIGSVAPDSTVSAFSSRGPTSDGRIKPDLMARGRLTTWAEADGGFDQVNGTSLSTPLVAGVVALLLEVHPEWGPGDVIHALRSTATEAGAPDNDHGWGIVRAHAAAFEVEDPVYPLPFALLAPADSASVESVPLQFRWRRATDLQTPFDVSYQIELSSDEDFTEQIAVYPAGGDSLRSIDFLPSGKFFWRVTARDPDGHLRHSIPRQLDVQAVTASAPSGPPSWYHLSDARPNPFNPRVVIDFRLDHGARVGASIYDLAGRRVLTFPARSLPEGTSAWIWDGTDERGDRVSSGVYLFRSVAQNSSGMTKSAIRRLVLLR